MSMLRLSPYQWACPGWCLTQRLDGGDAVATDQGAGVRSRSRVKEVVWRWHSALRSRPGRAALLLTPASITRGGGEQVRRIRERRLAHGPGPGQPARVFTGATGRPERDRGSEHRWWLHFHSTRRSRPWSTSSP